MVSFIFGQWIWWNSSQNVSSWNRCYQSHYCFLSFFLLLIGGLPDGSVVKNLTAMWETGSVPGLERSSGEGNSNPLQYSCLKNHMDRRLWGATVHGVTKELGTAEQLSTSTVNSVGWLVVGNSKKSSKVDENSAKHSINTFNHTILFLEEREIT